MTKIVGRLGLVLVFVTSLVLAGITVPSKPPVKPVMGESAITVPSKPPVKPTMGDSVGETATECSHSIFETLVSWNQLLPDERSSRLTTTAHQHPDNFICATYRGQKSCCTAKTLENLVAWSDAVDSFMNVFKYTSEMVMRDPRLIFDQVLIAIHAIDSSEADWKQIREKYRDQVGGLIGDMWKLQYPVINKVYQEIITYREGLLCSACEPNFARFYDSTTHQLKLRDPAAAAVGDAMVDILNTIDVFLTTPSEVEKLKDLSMAICNQVSDSFTCTTMAPVIFQTAIKYLNGVPLRKLVCGKASKGQIAEANEFCKNFIMSEVLRGLMIDTEPILLNIVGYLHEICPAQIQGCSSLLTVKDKISKLFFTFDERPKARNIYVFEGYDIRQTACDSNLSGYACEGSGPRPEVHKPDAPAGNSGAVVISIVVLLVLSSLGGVLFISRHRIKRVTQNWYTRIRDGDEGLGPTVGLV